MKKKKYNIFWYFLLFSFFIFLAYYLAYTSGYYENKVSRRSIITEEGIKEFESDVSNNREIDIKKYVSNDTNDYSSLFSNIGNKLSNKIDSFMDGGMSSVFDFISRLFT